MLRHHISLAGQNTIIAFCFCSLRLFNLGVVGVIAVIMSDLMFFAFACSIWSLYFSDAIVAMKTGVIDDIFFSVHSSDVLID